MTRGKSQFMDLGCVMTYPRKTQRSRAPRGSRIPPRGYRNSADSPKDLR